MSAWQPIESAPTDGTAVLVSDGRYVGEAQSHDYYGRDAWYWANVYPSDYGADEIYPTHWMPLPTPPGASDDR